VSRFTCLHSSIVPHFSIRRVDDTELVSDACPAKWTLLVVETTTPVGGEIPGRTYFAAIAGQG
jgi:hypothetical protein